MDERERRYHRDDRRSRDDRDDRNRERERRDRHRDERDRGDRHRDERDRPRERGQDRYRDRRDREREDRHTDRKRSRSPQKGLRLDMDLTYYADEERESKRPKQESGPILSGPLITKALVEGLFLKFVSYPTEKKEDSAAAANKIKALADMLAMKKVQLEKQKKMLLEQKKEKEKIQPVPLALQSTGATGALLLDEFGREVDREGNVLAAAPVPQKHATTMANKKRYVPFIILLDQ